MGKLTTEEFINRANLVHKGKYDYSRVVYVNNKTPVEIICPIHGVFYQAPENHTNQKQGCPACAGNKQLTTQEFIKKAMRIHGNKYDYSLVVYVTSGDKIKIICPQHGIFEQRPAMHIRGEECRKCKYEKLSQKHSLGTLKFIERCQSAHGDKYDYSLVEYINNKTKVKIICKKHGVFEQLAHHHMRGRGCTLCGNEYNSQRSRSNTETFTEKARLVHGDRYIYSLVDYATSTEKIIIICKKHGQFSQTPSDHLAGYGCPECGLKRSSELRTYSTENFIELARQVHGDKYDYSLVEYNKAIESIKIVCPVHGVFEQKPVNHLQGKGCHKCGGTKLLTLDEFIQRAIEIHGSKYDYSESEYINGATKIKIVCPKHGEFFQSAQDHLSGHGCQLCYSSSGEEKIANILTRWGIRFTRQKKFNECRNKKELPFDFYFSVGKHHVLIEFDGGQHFKPVRYFGGIDSFENTKQNDAIKNSFAKKHGFYLIRLAYHQIDNIESVLRNEIEKHIGQPVAEIAKASERKRAHIRYIDPGQYRQKRLL